MEVHPAGPGLVIARFCTVWAIEEVNYKTNLSALGCIERIYDEEVYVVYAPMIGH